MDRNEASTLRDELNHGQRRLADLAADDFKGLMYWLLVDRFVTPTHQFEFSESHREEVAVALIEHLANPEGIVSLGPTERTYFFECNDYGRSFEPADLGKLFCAAIRHQPEVLALVSTRPLHAPALDYADLFFGLEGHFPRVEFHPLRAEFLLGTPPEREHSPVTDPDAATDSQSERTSTRSAEWRLIEHEKFNDRMIASSDAVVEPVRLVAGRRYTLEIRGVLRGLVDPREVEVFISRHGAQGAYFRSNKPPRVQGHDFRARFTLAPEAFAPKGEAAWMLEVHASKSRKTVSSLRLPEMDVADGVELLLPDARSGTSDSVSRAFRDGDSVITFFSGEAGVGKSYLCGQVASDLKFRYGYQVENFLAESVNDGLFLRVLLRLLTPGFREGNEDASDFEKQVIHEALCCLLREFAPTEVESLSQAIADRDADRATPDRIVPLLASLLAQSGDILLIIQDCHALSPTLIAPLAALVVALDERGWAGTRMLLEYRTGPGTDNSAWTEFVQRVQSTLHSRTEAIYLRNLSQNETDAFLRPLFDAINDDLITALWSRTGGNPLLLGSLLRSLVKTGAVRRPSSVETDRFRILQPVRILEGRLDMDDGPRQILKERIRLLDSTKPHGLELLPSVLPSLAIFALTDDLLPPNDAFQYFGLGQSEGARLIRWLTREEILSSSGDSSETVGFTHDLIRDTVVELGAKDEETLSVAERIADEVVPQGYPALLRMAQLTRYVGDLRRCREHLDRGQEAAKHENRFHWARRFQLQLLDLLRELPNATDRDRLAQLTLLHDLGRSERNTGSNLASREHFVEARELAERLPVGRENWTPQFMRTTFAQLDHQIMNIDLALLDFERFLASADRALKRVSDPTLLGMIINRLVVGCSDLGLVEEGMYYASAGIELASASRDAEVDAVLCHVISTFLAPGAPDEAARVAEQGTGLAHSARQRMHNEYASMKLRLWARGHVDPPEQQDDFHRRLRDLGMTILEGSLYNFEGIVQMVSGNGADARRLFSQAEVHARLYDQVGLEPVIWNNAMVAALQDGDIDSASTLVDRLLRFWVNLTWQRRRTAPGWKTLKATFEAARSRIVPPSGAAMLRLPSAPAFAGSFLPSLVNLVALFEAGWQAGEAAVKPAVLLSTWVGSAHERLSVSSAVGIEWNGISLYLDP
jgi:hypothetical protein